MKQSCNRCGWKCLLVVATFFGVAGGSARADVAPPLAARTAIGQWQVLEDPTNAATLEQVRAQSDRFRDVTERAPNYGFSKSAYWFRLPIENRSAAPLTLYLKSDHAALDYITLHVVAADVMREIV